MTNLLAFSEIVFCVQYISSRKFIAKPLQTKTMDQCVFKTTNFSTMRDYLGTCLPRRRKLSALSNPVTSISRWVLPCSCGQALAFRLPCSTRTASTATRNCCVDPGVRSSLATLGVWHASSRLSMNSLPCGTVQLVRQVASCPPSHCLTLTS